MRAASAPGSAAAPGLINDSVPPEQSAGNTDVLPRSVEIAVTSANVIGVSSASKRSTMSRDVVDEIRIRHRDALWRSGRTGRVHDVHEVVGAANRIGRRRRLVLQRGPVLVQTDQFAIEAGKAIEQCRLGHDHRRIRLGQLVQEARRRMLGVQRQIGAAGSQDPEQADDHLDRPIGAQADDHARPDTQLAEPVSELIDPRDPDLRSRSSRRRPRLPFRRAASQMPARTSASIVVEGTSARVALFSTSRRCRSSSPTSSISSIDVSGCSGDGLEHPLELGGESLDLGWLGAAGSYASVASQPSFASLNESISAWPSPAAAA